MFRTANAVQRGLRFTRFGEGANPLDALQRSARLLFSEAAVLICFADSGNGWRYRGPVVAQHSDVRARSKRCDSGLTRPVTPRDRAHAEVISKNRAVKTQTLAQNAVEQNGRKRGGPLRVNPGKQDVRSHHERHSGIDSGAERDQFGSLQTLLGATKHR